MGMRTAFLAAGLLLSAVSNAAQMDINTFNNLRRGMHEGEVLARAGEPDRVTSPRGYYAAQHFHAGPRTEFHYIPEAGEHDPWLTVVVLTHGRVSSLKRQKLFSPPVAAPAPTGTVQAPPRRDEDILRERAERTLRAAQRYSEVRSRIQERSGQDGVSGTGGARPFYSGTDEQGTPYYGDVAPSNARSRSPG